jgi:hypothetical protein
MLPLLQTYWIRYWIHSPLLSIHVTSLCLSFFQYWVQALALVLTLAFILVNNLFIALINAPLFALVAICCTGPTPALTFTVRLVVCSRAELAHPG